MFVANSEFVKNQDNTNHSELHDPYINKQRKINQVTEQDYDIVRNKNYIDNEDL